MNIFNRTSLKGYLSIGLVCSFFGYLVIVLLLAYFFKISAEEFILELCIENGCSESFRNTLSRPSILHPVFAATLFKVIPWLILLSFSIGIFSYLLYKEIVLPLQEMRLGALEFSKGAFNFSMPDYKIEELRSMANSMNTLGTKLESLEHMRKDFVANISHELKTPITSIKGYVETLLDGAVDDPQEHRKFLSVVKDQADRMNSIVEDLLFISKLENENSNLALERDSRNLANLLCVLQEQFAAPLKQKNIELQIDPSCNVVIECSEILLQQAIANLLDNSIKYGGDGLIINISAKVLEDRVVLSFSDNGEGIASNHLPRVFERFYRVDKARSRSSGGSGLGLSIVKHIVVAHGGTIVAKSEKGKGTHFIIELPF